MYFRKLNPPPGLFLIISLTDSNSLTSTIII
nr:MAG TPA: hypothetical protein [Caudoviricetes sp.]